MESEKRGRGRPKKDKPKTVHMNLRFDDEEAALIKRMAYDKGMSSPELIREAIHLLKKYYEY